MVFSSLIKISIIFVVFLSNISLILSISSKEFFQALTKIDFKSVKSDIFKMFTDSKEQWPADYGNYAPFFIRLAWHCAGTYRRSDGRGGCDGGRQRFEPERSWDDNTNLDKARALLWPIKEKYGIGLSWGDLIILTGNTAIEVMNGPVFGFCAGRIDDEDGSDSILLGPTAEQEVLFPCAVIGQCKEPLGANTIGLIYVNPEGPMGKPIPEESARDVRDVFGRMGMNDTETVALIGGGHSFGKAHGACPLGPGKKPVEDPEHPWQGKCGGDGKGKNTFTSGFEGAWTTNPLKFDNSYFKSLIKYNWEVFSGPGAHYQWRVASNYKYRPVAPNAHGKGHQEIMMLTTDVSLTKDPEYLEIIHSYAGDFDKFASDFSHAWYKLVTRDMGPVTRCFGDDVPPAQPFQFPLPAPSLEQPDWNSVRQAIIAVMYKESKMLKPDYIDNKPYYGGWFVKLAWQCANTFRQTDYLGGCNGARIRFSPQKDWNENIGMNEVLNLLQSVKDKFQDNLSWADLIVLAGTTALEEASGMSYDFCGGRTDALDGSGSESLNQLNYPNKIAEFKDRKTLMGLTNREMVALQAQIRSRESQLKLGYNGSWMGGAWGNDYYKILLNEKWIPVSNKEAKAENNANIFMISSDLVMLYDAPLLAIVQEYASDNNLFLKEFKTAWTKIMNSDRFDGPINNVCYKE